VAQKIRVFMALINWARTEFNPFYNPMTVSLSSAQLFYVVRLSVKARKTADTNF